MGRGVLAVLEWMAFSSSLLCVWCYGSAGVRGPIVGLTTAILFITFGFASGVYAAAFINLFFIARRGRNLRRALATGATS